MSGEEPSSPALLDRADSSLVDRLAPACNAEERRDGLGPDLLLLHYTGMTDAEAAVRWLTCPESRVSCHYLIDGDGGIVQMVPERLRAWHAGEASWAGVRDINSCSIGIEIHNPGIGHGYEPFGEAQMVAVVALCQDIVKRRGIRPERVLGHSDVAPLRKDDPGELFDWRRLWQAGVGHWVPPEPLGDDIGLGLGDEGPRVSWLQSTLSDYGYGLDASGTYDRATERVVMAFQRHWRPERVDGRADSSTVATLLRLSHRSSRVV
jgi:N-acetylmuramoyl-L-alanine amidase